MRATAFVNLGTYLAVLIGLSMAVRADDSEPRERVILMRTGRVLTGFASRNAGGWLVEQSNGRVQVPEDQVNVVADSLVDAYRKQRDSVVEPTPATHMSLAQWCISYRLHYEARDEVRKCLKLDPDHESARKLLKRLDDMLDPAEPARAQQSPAKSSDGFLVPEVESLGGLSNEAAVTFTQRIQPLLMNKCGNASCHGSTTPGQKSEGFHLNPVRLGSASHRIYTERNLAEVLRYVDLEEPSLSPLVSIPQGAHAGTAGVFHGAAGNNQLRMLRAWTKTVAAERRSLEEEHSSRPSIVTKASRPQVVFPGAATVAPEGNDDSPGKQSVASNPKSPPPLELDAETSAPMDLPSATPNRRTETKREEKPLDPFDPELFNRRFHAPASRK